MPVRSKGRWNSAFVPLFIGGDQDAPLYKDVTLTLFISYNTHIFRSKTHLFDRADQNDGIASDKHHLRLLHHDITLAFAIDVLLGITQDQVTVRIIALQFALHFARATQFNKHGFIKLVANKIERLLLLGSGLYGGHVGLNDGCSIARSPVVIVDVRCVQARITGH